MLKMKKSTCSRSQSRDDNTCCSRSQIFQVLEEEKEEKETNVSNAHGHGHGRYSSGSSFGQHGGNSQHSTSKVATHTTSVPLEWERIKSRSQNNATNVVLGRPHSTARHVHELPPIDVHPIQLSPGTQREFERLKSSMREKLHAALHECDKESELLALINRHIKPDWVEHIRALVIHFIRERPPGVTEDEVVAFIAQEVTVTMPGNLLDEVVLFLWNFAESCEGEFKLQTNHNTATNNTPGPMQYDGYRKNSSHNSTGRSSSILKSAPRFSPRNSEKSIFSSGILKKDGSI